MALPGGSLRQRGCPPGAAEMVPARTVRMNGDVIRLSVVNERLTRKPAKPAAYAELAVTTNFSFLRGASDPEELVETAKHLSLAGLGIADRNSVAGVVR